MLLDTQRAQQGGHTKLTAVTLQFNGKRVQFFEMLVHDTRGMAILPQATLNRILDKAGVRRGDTYSVA